MVQQVSGGGGEAAGSQWLALAVYLRELIGYLDTAVQAEGHFARLASGDTVERADFAARFETAAAAHAGGGAVAQALVARLHMLAVRLADGSGESIAE